MGATGEAGTVSETKRMAAEAAAALVEPGMKVGLGSGSTALLFVEALGARVRAGLALSASVATSSATEAAARANGLAPARMDTADAPTRLDLTVDGADEITDDLALIKGGGACLTREKIVAAMSERVVIVADEGKRVTRLGAFPLPIEVLPFGFAATAARLERVLGVAPRLRAVDREPVVTDNGNLVLDIALGAIDDPHALAALLSGMPGVVEHGLFLGLAHEALVGGADGLTRLLPRA